MQKLAAAPGLFVVALLSHAVSAQAIWIQGGGGCSIGGSPSLMCTSGGPFLGAHCVLECNPVEVGSPVFLYGGGSQNFYGIPLPLDVAFIARQPCSLVTDGVGGSFATIAADNGTGVGEAYFGFDFPNNQALLGMHIMFQAFAVIHPEPAGFALSCGIEAVIQ